MSEESKNNITIKEFKMWLQGVEEMQEDGWVPDARQWQRIREKIDLMNDANVNPLVASQPTEPPRIYQTNPNQQFIPAGPSLMSQAHQAPRMPVAQQPLSGPFANADSTQVPVRTPNIDTQGKPYESSFA